MRGISYTRRQRQRHINRKKKILAHSFNYWTPKHDGMLSKGKVHCSCYLCRSKYYDEPCISDKRKLDAFQYSLTSDEYTDYVA